MNNSFKVISPELAKKIEKQEKLLAEKKEKAEFIFNLFPNFRLEVKEHELHVFQMCPCGIQFKSYTLGMNPEEIVSKLQTSLKLNKLTGIVLHLNEYKNPDLDNTEHHKWLNLGKTIYRDMCNEAPFIKGLMSCVFDMSFK